MTLEDVKRLIQSELRAESNDLNVKFSTVAGLDFTPKQAYEGDAGFDLKAYSVYIVKEENNNSEIMQVLDGNVDWTITLSKGKQILIDTGIAIELPMGTEAQVRSRSGLSLKQQLVVVNSPGTIDVQYRDTIKVILKNIGDKERKIKRGDRIAQLVVCQIPKVVFEKVDAVDKTTRGLNGFGSSGVK